MPFDPELASRLQGIVSRLELQDNEVVLERKMFGGICTMLNGKMLAGVEKDRIVVRATDSELELGLADGSLVPMDLTGKPMRNFAFLSLSSMSSDESILLRVQASAQYIRAFMLSDANKTKGRA